MKLGSFWLKSSQYWNFEASLFWQKAQGREWVQNIRTNKKINQRWGVLSIIAISCLVAKNLLIEWFIWLWLFFKSSHHRMVSLNLEENCFNFHWVVCALPSWKWGWVQTGRMTNATWIRIFNTHFRLAGSPSPPQLARFHGILAHSSLNCKM